MPALTWFYIIKPECSLVFIALLYKSTLGFTFTFFNPLAQSIHFFELILDTLGRICTRVIINRRDDLYQKTIMHRALFRSILGSSFEHEPACLGAAPKVINPTGPLIQWLMIRTSSCSSTLKSEFGGRMEVENLLYVTIASVIDHSYARTT